MSCTREPAGLSCLGSRPRTTPPVVLSTPCLGPGCPLSLEVHFALQDIGQHSESSLVPIQRAWR